MTDTSAALDVDPVSVAAHPGDVLDEMVEINGGQLHLRADRTHWYTVVGTQRVAPGSPMRFTTDQIVGYLTVSDRAVVAVVGVCSRCGCLLLLDAASQALQCPASGTRYRPNGRVLNPAGHYRPAPLTRLHTRQDGGELQVLVPGPPHRSPGRSLPPDESAGTDGATSLGR